MKCVICGKKACIGFDSWPQSETMGLCEEHMTEVNIWRLQRMQDVKQADANKEASGSGKKQKIS